MSRFTGCWLPIFSALCFLIVISISFYFYPLYIYFVFVLLIFNTIFLTKIKYSQMFMVSILIEVESVVSIKTFPKKKNCKLFLTTNVKQFANIMFTNNR